jgi:predicted amidohydrolase YtcJ
MNVGEVLLLGGKVLTVDPSFSVAEAVAVRGDRIVAVGSNAEARAAVGPDARVIDLGGRTVVPGLIDAHPHMDGMTRQYPSLADCTSIAEVQERIAERARDAEPGGWLIFRRLAEPEPLAPRNLKEKRFPTRYELDKAAPRNPVWIRGMYITPSVVNSRALELAGITRDTPQPKRCEPVIEIRTGDWVPSTGGHIEKDPTTGEPTGLLHDYDTLLARPATAPLWKLMRKPSYAEIVANLEQGVREFNAMGLTGAHESHGVAEPIEDSHRAYLDLWSRGELTVRTNMVTNIFTGGGEAEIVARIEALAHTAFAGAGDDYFRFGGVGVTIDGPGGAGDALQPKLPEWDGPDDEIRGGVLRVPMDKLRIVCREAARRGMRMSTKAGGEPAVEMLLEAYREADREFGIRDRRWNVFHSQFHHPRHMAGLRELGLAPATCATFLWNHGHTYVRYYGKELAYRAVPFRTFLDAGLPIANESDTYPKDPFFSMWLMVTRTDGETLEQMGDDQKITREEALRVYTNNGAYVIQQEDRLGSLEVGKYADLVVLREDYLTIPEEKIRDVTVLLTMVGGRITHQAEEARS